MSNHAITAVHRDPVSGQIQRVHWCRTNESGDHLLEAPHEADVAEVIRAIADGAQVFPLFQVDGLKLFGVRLTLERTAAAGYEQLRMADTPRTGRGLRDLPHF